MAKSEFTCDCTVIHADAVAEVSAKMPPEAELSRAAMFFRILGDPTRMKLIWALAQRELCVCDLANVLGMTKSAVSHQLATLRGAALVCCRRDGKTVYYSLADGHVRSMAEAALEHTRE